MMSKIAPQGRKVQRPSKGPRRIGAQQLKLLQQMVQYNKSMTVGSVADELNWTLKNAELALQGLVSRGFAAWNNDHYSATRDGKKHLKQLEDSVVDLKVCPSEPSMFAYCGSDGLLQFGPVVPSGMLPVVRRCPDLQRVEEWKDILIGLCRRSYGGNPLVPGIPEATSEDQGLVALENFRKLVEPVIDKEFGNGVDSK